MSFSQNQLLKTMLFYDLQNHVNLEIDKLKIEGKDTSELEIVQRYMEHRISELQRKLK